MASETTGERAGRPWAWVPTLYFVQGLPYALVNNVAPVLYKNLGVGNAQITFWTSWISFLWTLKPLWSPVVDARSTKRRWVVACQVVLAPLIALVALALPLSAFFQATIVLLFGIAFVSATHDIAADGLYMLGLSQGQQSGFVGVRSAFWRLALLSSEGGLVWLSGRLAHTFAPDTAWAWTLLAAAVVLAVSAAWHFFALPVSSEDRARGEGQGLAFGVETFAAFFRKDGIVAAVGFILFYRFAENQLVKLIAPFLLDPRADGGLGLTNEQYGFAKGTVGVLALVIGGLLGGASISRWGLRACLWPMVAIMHLPDLVFVYLSWVQPESYGLICALIGVEQFGYGFGFTAYMMYLIRLAEGPYKTAHYAIATGLMALSVTLTGMFTGALQEAIGYRWFFLWVVVSIVPGVIVAALVRVEPEFGKAQGGGKA